MPHQCYPDDEDNSHDHIFLCDYTGCVNEFHECGLFDVVWKAARELGWVSRFSSKGERDYYCPDHRNDA